MFRDFINNFDYSSFTSSCEDVTGFLCSLSKRNQAFEIGHEIIETLLAANSDMTRMEACKLLELAVSRRRISMQKERDELLEYLSSIDIEQVD